MVPPTQRDGEFIADFACKRATLGKSQMVSIRRLSAADQARSFGDGSDLLAVANPARLR